MIILRQSFYSSSDLSNKTYVPYEEQKRRTSRANLVGGLGAAASLSAGAGYYGLKHRSISKQAASEIRGAKAIAENQMERGNATWGGRVMGKITGRTRKIERSLEDTINKINQTAQKRKNKAALVGLGVAGVGTAAALGARAMLKRRKSKV